MPVIIIGLIAFLGFGTHGNILFSVCTTIILAVVYFFSFEQCATLFTSLWDRRKFVTYKLTWVELAGKPALLLKPILTFYLHWNAAHMTAVSPEALYAAVGGVCIVLAAGVFSILTVIAWSTMFVGHGIQENQKVITSGIYARVRNPIYLADILYWIGLAVGTLSIAAGVVTVVYVIPFYIMYIKAEENMMLENFGDDYYDYLKKVPRLIPSFHAYGKSPV
jgi:protein-S-isoprenylcysteine O-methyltransferase Ste14